MVDNGGQMMIALLNLKLFFVWPDLMKFIKAVNQIESMMAPK